MRRLKKLRGFSGLADLGVGEIIVIHVVQGRRIRLWKLTRNSSILRLIYGRFRVK